MKFEWLKNDYFVGISIGVAIVLCGLAIIKHDSVYAFYNNLRHKNDSTQQTTTIPTNGVNNKSTTSSTTATATSPKNNAQSQSSTSPTSYSSVNPNNPYKPGTCTKTIIPRKTIYRTSTISLSTLEGWDGYKETCTADSNGFVRTGMSVDPMDRVVYIPATTSGTSGTTYAQAYEIAISNCRQYGNTSAYQPCISAYLKKYGF